MIDTPQSIAAGRNAGKRMGTGKTMVLWYNYGEYYKRALTMLVAPSSPVHENRMSVPMSTPKHTSDDLFGHLLAFTKTDEYRQIAEAQAAKELADQRRNSRKALAVRRARMAEQVNDFTDTDWQRCVDYWHGCCAYCGKQQSFWDGIERDHFIPVNSPNCPGTIPENIVPACADCNARKHDRSAAEWLTEQFGGYKANQRLKAIRAYFATLKNR